MSSSRDNRRENRDVTRSLADKDGQVQALQERILKMEEEIARKGSFPIKLPMNSFSSLLNFR